MAKRRKVEGTASGQSDDVSDLFAEAAVLPSGGAEPVRVSPLDEHFARLMIRLNGAPNVDLESAARAVSAWRGSGHSCVPLAALHPAPGEFATSLRTSPVVGAPGEWKPLILDSENRLYLHRYWNYESEITAVIRGRCAWTEAAVSPELQRALDEVMGREQTDQRRAAEIALSSRFCVITGGPGTGKTRTVAYITTILQRLAPAGKRPRIALAAPTGKAAARIGESLRKALAELRDNGQPVPEQIPEPATLHRLLGASGDLSTARHGAHHPIPADVVIADEASMIDLALMWRLVTALLPHARLILLGDKDQLASVEAGNVFGDLCGGASGERTGTLSEHIAVLNRSYRVEADSGLRRISQRIQSGSPEDAIAGLFDGNHEDVELIAPTVSTPLPRAVRDRALNGYRAVLAARNPEAALAEFGKFRVLCALRNGLAGVDSLNQLIERALQEKQTFHIRGGSYRGRPIMILENDYGLRLFNGDIGIVWPSEGDGSLRAFFPNPDGTLRQIAITRLPRHETAWAMTVHKSQGSEFEQVLLVLPQTDKPVLTRELIYTAITRARRHLTICGSRSIIQTATSRPTQRFSGLRDALWRSPLQPG